MKEREKSFYLIFRFGGLANHPLRLKDELKVQGHTKFVTPDELINVF